MTVKPHTNRTEEPANPTTLAPRAGPPATSGSVDYLYLYLYRYLYRYLYLYPFTLTRLRKLAIARVIRAS